MSTPSLADRYCPEAHVGEITAAAFDAQSGASVTADAWGVVAITRPGERTPAFVFTPGGPVHGALAISPGGALAAVGDDDGMITVYKTWDGAEVFRDEKPGSEGQSRAMRALAFHPNGTILATLSVDGIVRVFDIQRWQRIVNWQGYSGSSLNFDPKGDHLLVVDNLGQPKLLAMLSHEQIDLELVPGGVQTARFTPDGGHVVTLGGGGVTLIAVPEGRIANSFSARSSSGLLDIAISPQGDRVAAISQRSVHQFDLPGLTPIASEKHGAPDPAPLAWWDWRGIVIPSRDGRIFRPGGIGYVDPILACTGYGDHRVSTHGDKVAVWTKGRRRRPFPSQHKLVEVKIDRDGRLVGGVPDDGSGIQVFEAKSGRHLFDGGRETGDTSKLDIGGAVVAVALKRGGVRWYELKNNQIFELDWVQHFALSGGGTWLGVVTPKGHVRVLDPATGEDAIPAPEPISDVPVALMSFVNRRPDLLVLDEDGVLSVYDLSVSVTEGRAALGEDVLDLNVSVDRLWGITGGKFAAVRFQVPETETATVIFVDLDKGEVVSEVQNLLPYAWVDPESGCILQPTRGNAILELDMYGNETRVYRALPEGHWVTFGHEGIQDASEGAPL
jgi:WD40 repeat protein